ncbi:hypothetical protein FRC00_013104 [Tulasnella sp. 408]|nr:hypothetical protein FRC00_013104 [Tulasnella sp. 408]
MSSSTVTSTAALASASSFDYDPQVTKDYSEGRVIFSVGVVRVRMVRRRRLMLGLPPPLALRRLMNEEMKDWKPKPLGELHPLSLSKILSEPVPRKPKEKRNVFVNYTTSILELFSVERMDKALLDSMRREDPTPEFTNSELAATLLVAMPRAIGYDAMEGVSLLPELEVGVYLGNNTDRPWDSQPPTAASGPPVRQFTGLSIENVDDPKEQQIFGIVGTVGTDPTK